MFDCICEYLDNNSEKKQWLCISSKFSKFSKIQQKNKSPSYTTHIVMTTFFHKPGELQICLVKVCPAENHMIH